MKRFIAVALFVLFCRIAFAEKKKPNPADFPLVAHTLSSARTQAGQFSYFVLDVTLDGREMELESNAATPYELLPVMDYQAKLDPPDKWAAKHARPYAISPSYTLLMPDGSTIDFDTVRIGPPATQTAPEQP